MRIFRKGFNFSQDGPGNRLVYHIQGCNLRCRWCCNPESMDTGGGEEIIVDEIIKDAQSCKLMFFGGGGVTFTGGEATLFFNELLEVLKKLKENGIHTALETNGTSSRLHLLEEYIDYLIMDFKHYNSEIHKEYTGAGNDAIRANFERICKSGRQLLVRIPLVKEFNCENPQGFAKYFKENNTENVVFEFLRYHEYGKSKWTTPYLIKDGFVPDKTVKEFEEAFKNAGLKVIYT